MSGNLSTQETSALFATGWWQDLEAQLRSAVQRNAADAKSAFRLANLLFYQGEWPESLRLFDVCIVQRWPGALSSNNKGVVLSYMGQARPAIACFQEAADCAPALFNLGILCERLSEDGQHLPPLVAEILNRKVEAQAGQIAMECFSHAETADWGRPHALDRPLYLWRDDIPSGFGFISVQALDDLRQAHALMADGLGALEASRWQEAINRLDAAGAMHKPLIPQTVEPRTRALLSICHEHRTTARLAWDRHDFEAARLALESLLSILPGLPDQLVVVQILTDEIGYLSEQIRLRKPGQDWGGVQAQTASARLVLNTFHRIASVGQAQAAEDRLKNACLEAWTSQADFLNTSGYFDDALTLLQMEEWHWIGEQEQERQRRKVYLAKTKALWDGAERLALEGRLAEARSQLAEARDAALQMGDASVVDSCDVRLGRLEEGPEEPDRTELWEMLAHNDLEGLLARCEQLISERAGGRMLTAIRSASILRLLELGEAALREGRWVAALERAHLVLTYAPDTPRAKTLEQRAHEGLSAQLVSEITNAIDARRFEEAATLLGGAFKECPGNQHLLELQRRLIVACHEAGPVRWQEYDKALQSFLEARESRRIEDALESYLRMRELGPDSPQTLRAWAWISLEFIEHLKRQFASDASPETAQRLQTELKRILALDSKVEAGMEFEQELLRAARGSEQERRMKSADLLTRAEKAYNDFDPVEALNHVRRLEELDDPAHRAGTSRCKVEALRQLQKRIDGLLAAGTAESLADADKFIDALRQWDEAAAATARDKCQRKIQSLESRLRMEAAFEEIRDLTAGRKGSAVKRLREFDRRVRDLRLPVDAVEPAQERELDRLRKSILASSSWVRVRTGMRNLLPRRRNEE